MINYFSGIVMVPIMIKDPVLLQQVTVSLGVREGSKNSEFCKIKINFKKKIDQPFDIIFRLIVKSEEKATMATTVQTIRDQVIQATADIRRAMTQKYQVEF